ncbi:SDR family NAD(P)-dependent oxidoreductase [Mesorhizobium sp. M0598]|uniref:SDR family NAD(P)-dependent oxidoreductase n=1 Tax=Mesorhizobium sp. M0598 TaxID=2956968 RepID=UPI0033364E7A
MKGHGGGAIVNIASCWGLYPGPGHVAYCTSKAAVAAFPSVLAATMQVMGYGSTRCARMKSTPRCCVPVLPGVASIRTQP